MSRDAMFVIITAIIVNIAAGINIDPVGVIAGLLARGHTSEVEPGARGHDAVNDPNRKASDHCRRLWRLRRLHLANPSNLQLANISITLFGLSPLVGIVRGYNKCN